MRELCKPCISNESLLVISFSKRQFLVWFILGLFGQAMWHVGSYFPDQGLNPCPLQWRSRVLTTGLPGRTLGDQILCKFFQKKPDTSTFEEAGTVWVCAYWQLKQNKRQYESWELIFIWGKMRIAVWEIAPQIALRKCSKESVGEGSYRCFWWRESSHNQALILQKVFC